MSKEKVIGWYRNGCDFNEGCSLLNQLVKNKRMVANFSRNANRYAGNVKYHLCKSVGLTVDQVEKMAGSVSPVPTKVDAGKGMGFSDEIYNSENFRKKYGPEALSKYPPLLQKVVNQISSMFKTRSQLHAERAALPDDNSFETMKKRKSLSDQIRSLSSAMDVFYEARKNYDDDKILPDEKIFTMVSNQNNKKDLPDDLDKLKDMKKRLQTSNSKARNKLDYQSVTKKGRKNPMPEGPKRAKLLKKIDEREELITQIEYRISEL